MKKVIDMIKNADSICVLGHISEDADSVASCAAAKNLLEAMGKRADIYLSAELEKRLRFIGVQARIYDGAPQKYELALCIDCGDKSRLGARAALFDAAEHTAQIDHHGTNDNFAEANYVVAEASSAGELVYDVFSAMGVPLDKKASEYIFTAIASDTGSFKYSNVSPKTMRVAAELLETGIDNAYISRMLFDTSSAEQLRFRGYLMSRVKTFAGGRGAAIFVSERELEEFGIDEKDTGDIVNIPRGIEGVAVAVSVRGLADKVKLSFRSNGEYPVDVFAAYFGGGGHRMAAGATVTGRSYDELCAEAVTKIEEVLADG